MSAHSPVLILVPGSRPADPAAPALLVTDLAATRGDGVFETIGVFDGRAVNVGPHLDRLERSARMMDLPLPAREELSAAMEAAIAAHDPVAELTVRVIVSRGVEGSGEPTAWVHARAADDWSSHRAGMRVITLDRGLATTAPRTSPWLLAGAKSLSYAVNMAATREAVRRGARDVLFVASDGYVLEGPTSTLLVRRGEDFLTTPVSAGVLPGTSVGTLFAALQAEGRSAREELMTVADVAGSDGAWLLSSSRLAAPLTHLDEAELPVDRELTERFGRLLTGRD
ncbi:aminotransferase class IV [Brachybacterium sp. J153]|uniref:aminotransferase class IV n=1 Tax=Brachybacterium sp. J153 TaxID=3116488 RepID=UPI002E767EA4|nr:aminotransferase class IV [Brachybacterium sp. J153]MEE1619578.1 aminotransferase class IV [Brachybacterium sp. J153]